MAEPNGIDFQEETAAPAGIDFQEEGAVAAPPKQYFPEVNRAVASVPRPTIATPPPSVPPAPISRPNPKLVQAKGLIEPGQRLSEDIGNVSAAGKMLATDVPDQRHLPAPALARSGQVPYAPETAEQRQREEVLAKGMGSAFSLATPAMLPAAVANPLPAAGALAAGYLTSRGTRFAAKQLGGSPEMQDLAEQMGWLITPAGLMDPKTGLEVSPGSLKAAVTAFGGGTGVSVHVTPEEIRIRGGVGPFKGEKVIPRGGKTGPGLEAPTIQAEAPFTRDEIARAQQATNYAGPQQAEAYARAQRAAQRAVAVSGEAATTPTAQGAEPAKPAVTAPAPEVPKPVAATPKARVQPKAQPPARTAPAAAEPVSGPTPESHAASEKAFAENYPPEKFPDTHGIDFREAEKPLDTEPFAKATEQARTELGQEASKEAVIARRNELVGEIPETRDIGARERAKNPEPTRAEVKAAAKGASAKAPADAVYAAIQTVMQEKMQPGMEIPPTKYQAGAIYRNAPGKGDRVPVSYVLDEMKRGGFTREQTIEGIKKLQSEGIVSAIPHDEPSDISEADRVANIDIAGTQRHSLIIRNWRTEEEVAPVYETNYRGPAFDIDDIDRIRNDKEAPANLRETAQFVHEQVVDTRVPVKDAMNMFGSDELAKALGGKFDKTLNAQPVSKKLAAPQFQKGDPVTLPDGRRAKVDYIAPADKQPTVRVTADDGEKVSLTKQKEIDQLKPGTKYKYGSTQANIPEGSEAHTALQSARERIADSDLAGEGKEAEPHVTVKYGIQGEDTEGLKKYLASLAPFEASLGKTAFFPPSKNSDGAAVIQAPIESPELQKINAEIEKHGDFAKSDFPSYEPHATVAYVKPEKASRYVGMDVTAGKKFPVNEIAITDKEGNAQIVKLEGKAAAKKPDYITAQEGSWFTKDKKVANSYGPMLLGVDVPEEVAKQTDISLPGKSAHSLPQVWRDKVQWAGDLPAEAAPGMVRLYRGINDLRFAPKKNATVPVPVEQVSGPAGVRREPEEKPVPSAGAGKAEQLPGGVPERPAAIRDQPERAAETSRQKLGLPPKPGAVGLMRTAAIQLAPQKFQYKLSTDAEGTSTLLKNVETWNPDLAGLVSVWRDPADGKTYVVNGHHRLELAKRTGQKEITVRHIEAPTASAARAIGAMQNIAEGRGTAVDAAKFFRDSGMTPEHLKEKGISLGEKTAQDGLSLSRLDPLLFNRVVAGDLRLGRATAVGEATADPAEQKAIVSLIERKERAGGKIPDDTLSELIRLVKSSQQTTETTADLFGTQEINRSLALEKADISAYIKQQLAKDKKLFGFVAKEGRASELERAGNKIDVERSREISSGAAQAEEVYNRLSERGGPIASVLDQSAKELADGQPADEVKTRAYQQVRNEISQTLGQGAERGAQGPQGAPAAPEANQQQSTVDASKLTVGDTFVDETGEPRRVTAIEGEKIRTADGTLKTYTGEVIKIGPLNSPRAQLAAGGMFHDVGLTDEELAEWSKSKGFRIEPAGEQMGMFGSNEPVLRAFRIGAKGKEQRGLVYQTQLDQLREQKSIAPTEPFALTGGEAKEEQPRLFGAGDLGEIIGPGKTEKAKPSKSEPQEESLFGGESGSFTPGALGVAANEAVVNFLQPIREYTAKARNLQRELETLDTQKQADILNAVQVMTSMKQAGMGKPDDAAIYHHLENPDEKLSANQQKWLDEIIQPIVESNEKLYTELSQGGVPIENYVHRVVKGKGGVLDRIVQGVTGVGQKSTLSKSAPQAKHRTYMVLEKAPERTQGNVFTRPGDRMVVSIKGGQVTAWRNGQPENLGGISSTEEGRAFEDKDGNLWALKQATTKEIERETDTKYYHSSLASTLVSSIQLGSAVRAMRFLEAYKGSDDFRETGWDQSKGPAPKGWQTTSLQQFKGYAFEPRTAEVLDWYHDRMRQGNLGALDQVGKLMRVSMLLNPIMHPMNVAASWAVEKGASYAPMLLAPSNLRVAWRTGTKAVKAVISKNQDYLDALDAGAPLQSHREAIRDISQLFFDQLSEGLEKEDPWAMKVAKALGIEKGNLLNPLHKISSTAAWFSNDMFLLQSAYENQAKNPGMSLKDALRETGRIIPEYRVPTRILDSPLLSKLMTNRWATMFGAYHYSLLKSFAEVAKSALGAQEPPPGRTKAQEVAKGWDRLAILGIITMLLYPALDELAKKATGDKQARARRNGPFGLIDAVASVAKKEQSVSTAAQRAVTPAPQTKSAAELLMNREFYSGHQIYDPHAHYSTQAQQVGHYLVDQMGQLGQWEKAQTKEQKRRFWQGQAGATFRKSPAEKMAADIAMSKVGTEPEDPQDQENRVLRRDILDALRKGDLKPLQDAEAKHEITRKQAQALELRGRRTPLQDTVHGFSYKEIKRVYEVASPEEKKELDHLVRQKLMNLLRSGRPAPTTPSP